MMSRIGAALVRDVQRDERCARRVQRPQRRRILMKSIKLGCVVLTAAALGGCGSNDLTTGNGNAPSPSARSEGMEQSSDIAAFPQPLPTTSGTFSGHYVVPAPPELTAAARYSVDAVDWFVNRGRVLLRY